MSQAQSTLHEPLIDISSRIPTLNPQVIIDKSCCCFNIATFPEAEMTLCNHWIFRPIKPTIIIFVFLFVFALSLYDIIAFSDILDQFHDHHLKFSYAWVAVGLITLIFLFMTVSYFGVLCIGPGYLPYNWSQTRKTELTWEETKNSFVVYKEQVEFARAAERPPRSSFSISARRYVLRADHFCLWTESWIGLKNHRFFLLMTFYEILFTVTFICVHHWWAVYFFSIHYSEIKRAANIVQIIIPLIITVALILVSCMAVYHFFVAAKNLARNLTSIERFKGIKPSDNEFDKGCFNNCAEVCGKKIFCPLWFIPFFCFKPLEDGLYLDHASFNSTL
ncbi:DHHC zinc finger domain containing protein [Tritrichomonas foetus]|uniref:Palmitoyltransferase n=1 Tax=Tritrichomonas foetus TaxID=1144522 RepID=A0A1J4JM75_9EUKA|nr:DHHC zinc finger domain containing protein [Tritrichomonas foetus]|eukprot:OHS98667.1 DHHC zinc finger domain containing protein [Tritrichomonas foetus]